MYIYKLISCEFSMLSIHIWSKKGKGGVGRIFFLNGREMESVYICTVWSLLLYYTWFHEIQGWLFGGKARATPEGGGMEEGKCITINIKFGVSTFIISIFPEPLFLRGGAP